jgi:hypothetical protein
MPMGTVVQLRPPQSELSPSTNSTSNAPVGRLPSAEQQPGVQVPPAMRSTSERPQTSMEINAAIAPSTTLPTSSSLIMGMPPPIKVSKSRMW